MHRADAGVRFLPLTERMSRSKTACTTSLRVKWRPPSRILQSSMKTTAPALFWQTHSIMAGLEVSPASSAALEKPSIACGSRIASVLPVFGPGE